MGPYLEHDLAIKRAKLPEFFIASSITVLQQTVLFFKA